MTLSYGILSVCLPLFFFFNDTATTEIYTLSLHDALPICASPPSAAQSCLRCCSLAVVGFPDRNSTRLNSSHDQSSYAVFCLKKKIDEAANYDQPKRVGSMKCDHQVAVIN